jgi:hypothetical protein
MRLILHLNLMKVKFALEQAMKAQRESGGTVILILGARWG